jgi:hypothetical protein
LTVLSMARGWQGKGGTFVQLIYETRKPLKIKAAPLFQIS